MNLYNFFFRNLKIPSEKNTDFLMMNTFKKYFNTEYET